jgi:hypothetical protein
LHSAWARVSCTLGSIALWGNFIKAEERLEEKLAEGRVVLREINGAEGVKKGTDAGDKLSVEAGDGLLLRGGQIPD